MTPRLGRPTDRRGATAIRVHALALALAVSSSLVAGCPKAPPAGDAGPASSAATKPSAVDPVAIAKAEDLRRAKDVPVDARTSHDVATRRRSARAFARIADAASLEPLVAHLADEDLEVVSWAAYGLAFACKGREEAHVKLLAARAASLPLEDAGVVSAARGSGEIDVRRAIARAIGKCGGGPLGEQVLVSLAKSGGAWLEPALVGLGDLALRKKQLGADAMTVLLESVTRDKASSDIAFYALSRAEAGAAFAQRVIDAAEKALVRSGDARILAIKALARAGRDRPKDAFPGLIKVITDAKAFSPGERAEAARSLGTLGTDGQAVAADTLVRIAPDKDPVAIQALAGPEFHVLHTLLGAIGPEPSKKVEPTLVVLANLVAPSEPTPALARRLAEIRCAAALGLARGAHDAEVLRKCDAETSETSQRARLTSLLRRPVTGERRNLLRTYAKSDHLRIREQVIEAIGEHAELGEVGAAMLAEALGSKKAGLVATAAETIATHPERVMVLAESEKRAALDPKSPPPSADPRMDPSPAVRKALSAALAEKWPEDRFETKIALVEAAAAVRHPEAKAVATAACNDANSVVRERAQKALRTLGEAVAGCAAPDREAPAAPEIGAVSAAPQKVVFTIDGGGALTVVLEPDLSPITATRIASLVKNGFYKGIVVHRVVPGFVVQFGDPEGDGYGGAGTPLRCETSPVPFAPLEVGMALAGRDTGSSQLFVTLSRAPHLDGEYTRVGRAEGDWSHVAQGDMIVDAKLVDEGRPAR
ncbi:MAG: peptidylprolyl isomerase [Deltaproteobacteria bacterium]|nr:peptidylprolyl isomerase [Deltaproteobacteria bacterium]